MIIQSSAQHPQINNIENERIERIIREMVGKIVILLSIKIPPSDDSINLIVEFLKKHYKTATTEEFVTAAEMMLIGEVENVEDFQVIDPKFLSRLYNNFRIRKMKAFQELNKIKPPDQFEPMTDQRHYEFIESYYIEYKKFPAGNYHAAFNHYWQESGLKPSDVIKWFESRKVKILAELKAKFALSNTHVERQVIELQMKEDAIKSRCRKEFLQEKLTEKWK